MSSGGPGSGAPAGDLAIGVDIGGSKVVAGVVDRHGTVLDSLRVQTPAADRDPQHVEDAIADLVGDLAARYDVGAVGIGAAGWLDETRSRVVFAPHLPWRNEPLREVMSRRLQLPVVIENDANAAAWAEWRFGVGRGESHLICITLGTGIGGAILVDGGLQRGRFGMAGEFGHMTVVPGGHRCACGNRGCWEQYASGHALVREARELAAADSPLITDLLGRAGGDVGRITGPLITTAANAGDRAAMELFAGVGTWLGLGIAGLAAALDPGLVILGGGVSEAGELLLGPAKQAYRRQLPGRGFRAEARLVLAELGNLAGLIGAADLARRELSAGAPA